jgi:transposase-like protein
METDSRKTVVEGSRRFDADTIEREIRERIRTTIELFVEEELEATVGARPSQRVGSARQGYRHGHRERRLTTSVGATTIAMPRARMEEADGRTAEWQSRTVRRYERRTQRVHEAILGVYLSGTNTRRIKGALAGFRKKWQLRCPNVVQSLDEAGDDLFTFTTFPPLQWKALRTTNAPDRINGEFRRRTKTQASLPGQDAILLLLFGLLQSGRITLRRIDGWKDLPAAPAHNAVREKKAA